MSTHDAEANSFSAEFLDDYFAECEEHLVAVRRELLELEEMLGQSQLRPSLLEDLFRSFHTLKGISGMVGLSDAERLAHEMENYLRALRQAQVRLTPEGIGGLMAGAKMLDQVIAARRAEKTGPDITALLKQLDSLIPIPDAARSTPSLSVRAHEKPGAGLDAEQQTRLAEALHGGARVWQFCFTPSDELMQRGVNVNAIRARLLKVGELIRATPLVTAQSGIAFEFLVAAHADDAEIEALSSEGLTYSQYQGPQPAALPEAAWVAPAAGSAFTHAAPTNVVRVDLARLDELMRLVGNLVITRSRFKDQLDRIESKLPAADWQELQQTEQTIERQLRDLREGVMRTRMAPVGEVFERMRFVVRDLARESEKKINLEIIGQETEIDKFLVERLMDPLLHLVRNAVSHGLETTPERVALGKPLESKLTLRAATSGETVILEVEDDGRGIDAARVMERASAGGLIDAEAKLDEGALLDLICTPGFSTRDEADRTSGRGVGMAVVRKAISDLGGTLALRTRSGSGSCFIIQAPLTLAITDALIVTAGGQKFAIPQAGVREVIEVPMSEIRAIENNEIIHYRGAALPLLRLTRAFGLVETQARNLYACVVGDRARAAGVVVDRIFGMREIVVRAMTDPLLQAPGIAGATELGDGRPVLILDAVALLHERGAGFKGAL